MARYVSLTSGTEARLAAVVLLMLLLVGSAAAHVTVLPAEAPAGAFVSFTVRVPGEKDLPTVSVRVEFPTGMIVSRFQPKPGWERAVEKDTAGRIVAATWSGGRISADEYEEFTFLARTPSEPGPLTFRAFQTYEGGEVVAWAGGAEDAEPAPVVEVTPDSTGTPEPEATHAATPVSGTAPEPASTPTTAAETTPTNNVLTEALLPATPQPHGTRAGASTPPATTAGSDLPLFVGLSAFAASLIALAVAGVALFRPRGAAEWTSGFLGVCSPVRFGGRHTMAADLTSSPA